MGSLKRTNKEWAELVTQQRMSGQTLKMWCAENGINLHTMSDRISRLRKAGLLSEQKSFGQREDSNGAEWVEVKSSAVDSEIKVKVNGFTVVVPVDFHEMAFVRICKVLMSLC